MSELRSLEITDIHTHGIKGLTTATSSPDEILQIARTHFLYGVKNIVLSIYPAPIAEMRKNLEAVKKAMEIQSTSYPHDSARILGVHLEGPFLNRKMAGALNGEYFLEPDEKRFEELTYGFEDIIRIVTIAPELKGAQRLIRKIREKGILVSMGHSEASYSEAELGYRSGAVCITHIFNAMRGIHHRELGIAGFGLLKKDVYLEVIGDLEHVDFHALELIFRLKEKDRVILISDSYRGTYAGKKKKGERLEGGFYPLSVCAERLIRMGFEKELVFVSVTSNPIRFLSGAF